MTKRKSVVSKMLLLVVILTLVSCCFLGSTFARYTSTGSGTGTVNVAKWDVKYEAGATQVEEAELSPSKEAYTGGGSYVAENARKNTSERKLVATITNSGDVDALVSLQAVVDVVTKEAEATHETYTDEVIKGMFSVTLYTSTEDNAEGATEYSVAVNVPAKEGTLYVYATVTWTSDDESTYGTAADARDTWIGQNVSAIGFTVTYTADQNTQIPDSQA